MSAITAASAQVRVAMPTASASGRASARATVSLGHLASVGRPSAIFSRHASGAAAAQRSGLVVRATMGPAGPPGGGMSTELKGAIDKFVTENKVVMFMKGTKQFPQCGFSNTCVQILNNVKATYETVNILEDEGLRSGMKEYSNWPTFPQVYIDGEFFGGCDIMIEAYQSGELQEEIEKVMAE